MLGTQNLNSQDKMAGIKFSDKVSMWGINGEQQRKTSDSLLTSTLPVCVPVHAFTPLSPPIPGI